MLLFIFSACALLILFFTPSLFPKWSRRTTTLLWGIVHRLLQRGRQETLLRLSTTERQSQSVVDSSEPTKQPRPLQYYSFLRLSSGRLFCRLIRELGRGGKLGRTLLALFIPHFLPRSTCYTPLS